MTAIDTPKPKNNPSNTPNISTNSPRQPNLRPGTPESPTREAIARRAYEIWERKGRPDGQSQQNWQEAEAELRRS